MMVESLPGIFLSLSNKVQFNDTEVSYLIAGRLMARPRKYKEEFAEQAKKLCALGSTDIQLADFFGVVESTINKWKIDFPEFSESLKEGKRTFDNETVVKSLLHRAIGYSHKEEKILSNPKDPNSPIVVKTTKHYPPDATSCIYWLNNRLPKDWKNQPREPIGEVADYVINVIRPNA